MPVLPARAAKTPIGPARPRYQDCQPCLQDLEREQPAELEDEALTHEGMGSRSQQLGLCREDKRGGRSRWGRKMECSALIWPFP